MTPPKSTRTDRLTSPLDAAKEIFKAAKPFIERGLITPDHILLSISDAPAKTQQDNPILARAAVTLACYVYPSAHLN